MLALTALSAFAATPFAGVAWQPLGRDDLVWVGEDRTSGLAVGEFDGAVRPALGAFGGAWLSKHFGLEGSLGIARLTTTTWVGDTYRQRHWGVIRPAVDARFGLGPRTAGTPEPWLFVGVHGDIPSARDTSNAYTTEEQTQADEDAYAERLRLGGYGGRVGAGVELRVVPQVAIGARYALSAHFGVLRSSESSVVSSWIANETELLLTFEWPK